MQLPSRGKNIILAGHKLAKGASPYDKTDEE
jgi:hypothetical protein